MASKNNEKGEEAHKDTDGGETPDWAGGLRQLYDSVVDEPLPDSFMDLLAQLDESDTDEGKKA
ncbi:hypothetical protein FGU71_07815 [Erythrobacter insulae]|uniref:Anti-sigma factor NepR domain-containing protein n=1 Tax=Erythrobacter insulae TaxID=2584124 RepID=A0A547PCA3_9SPHN|nr:NepR family anti-sigma factor [Erythrobacter insulae]TRD11779.1 hypothetical protein FGU71_07815 [Erythrobacter insulae]